QARPVERDVDRGAARQQHAELARAAEAAGQGGANLAERGVERRLELRAGGRIDELVRALPRVAQKTVAPAEARAPAPAVVGARRLDGRDLRRDRTQRS